MELADQINDLNTGILDLLAMEKETIE